MIKSTFVTSSPILYVVATPIGNLKDITLRAIETLKQVDLIAAEDTRRAGLLLQKLGIENKLLSLHDHNELQRTTTLIEQLKSGRSVALVADAGTPLINDPGYHLVRCCHQQGIRVIPIPGACAAIAALSAAGIASDRFCYEGFLPTKKRSRQDRLQLLANETRTTIFYESTHRLLASLRDIVTYFGSDRQLVLAKELTKTWETIIAMPVGAVLNWLEQDAHRVKGEFVLVVEGYHQLEPINANTLKILKTLLEVLPMKKAIAITADVCNAPRNRLYNIALQQQSKSKQ